MTVPKELDQAQREVESAQQRLRDLEQEKADAERIRDLGKAEDGGLSAEARYAMRKFELERELEKAQEQVRRQETVDTEEAAGDAGPNAPFISAAEQKALEEQAARDKVAKDKQDKEARDAELQALEPEPNVSAPSALRPAAPEAEPARPDFFDQRAFDKLREQKEKVPETADAVPVTYEKLPPPPRKFQVTPEGLEDPEERSRKLEHVEIPTLPHDADLKLSDPWREAERASAKASDAEGPFGGHGNRDTRTFAEILADELAPHYRLLIGFALLFAVVVGSAFFLAPRDAPGAAAPVARTGPSISRFRAVLAPPATTYAVEVANPGGGALTYEWSANNSCGSFQPSSGPTAVWSHPHDVSSRASCPAEPIHPGTITVAVRDAAGREATYTYTGGSAPADIEVD